MNVRVYIGEYCIEPDTREDVDGEYWVWITNESGEGGQFKEKDLAAAIAEFYKAHF